MADIHKENFAENLLLFLETKDPIYFNFFYNNLYPLAFKVSILLTKNAADAEDVAQTAFYTVFNQIETCQSLKEKDSTKVKSWFLSIVYNQSKLVVRTRVRTKKKEQSQKIKIQTKESKNQMSAYLENQMKAAIDSLDEKYRTPIILKYNEGLKSAEIAGILNVNEETLRVRIRRGLAKVKDLLANDKQEFEKLLPSIALISFDNYSVVPPTPKFVNKDLINSKLLAQKASFGLAKVIFLCAAVVSIAIYLGYQNLPQNIQVDRQTVPTLASPSKQVALTRMEWDLTKGNKDGIQVVYGNWDFVNDGMVTTGMQDPNATLLIPPIIPNRYFKIHFQGKIEFDPIKDHIPYVVHGVLLKNNNILPQKYVLDKFISTTIYPNTGKKEFGLICYPFEATVYFTKNYIGTRYKKENIIGSIVQFNAEDKFEKVGILIREFKAQKIEYIPITEKEAQELEEEMKNNIKNLK